MMLCPRRLNINWITRNIKPLSISFYSKRSSSKNSDTVYKIVKVRDGVNDFDDSAAFGPSPNWELLGPPGYRFYMPEARGKSTVFTSTTTSMDCIAQECPMLLRQGVMELFPAMDVGNSNLTVVSLMQKVRGNEVEELAKHFVLAAQDICSKLKQAGFWADFINPFSGRPYLSPSNSLHYETDARFRCLGFHINEQANCKVISELKGARSFVGSLFTNAPASPLLLEEIFDQYE